VKPFVQAEFRHPYNWLRHTCGHGRFVEDCSTKLGIIDSDLRRHRRQYPGS